MIVLMVPKTAQGNNLVLDLGHIVVLVACQIGKADDGMHKPE